MTELAADGTVRVEIAAGLARRTRSIHDSLARDGVPAALMAKEPGLWGPAAARTAALALGWVDAAVPDPGLPAAIREVREKAASFDEIVLVGMGGSALAAEVVADAYGRRLTVLDTTDCSQVGAVLDGPLDRMLVVIASKSGETIETASVYAALWHAFENARSIAAPAAHFAAVTDPGSALALSAGARGFPVFLADPRVGGRYSALTPFGLVPAGLLGTDVSAIGAEAAGLAAALRRPDGNPGLLLGAALGATGHDGAGTLYLATAPGFTAQFAAWAEQLIAESTGKEGRGILPVAGARLAGAGPGPAVGCAVGPGAAPATAAADIGTYGSLGAQFLLWEYAVAVACRILRVNPFDQPNVQEAKDRTREILGGRAARGAAGRDERVFTEAAVEVGIDRASDRALAGADSLRGLFAEMAALLGDQDYLAVVAYLDRYRDSGIARLPGLLASHIAQPVTFGWGPRYLHSTGQYHKGGPAHGVFVVITGEADRDIPVPGGYSLAGIQRAQARADIEILRGRGRPVIRVHLRDRREGAQQVLEALGDCGPGSGGHG